MPIKKTSPQNRPITIVNCIWKLFLHFKRTVIVFLNEIEVWHQNQTGYRKEYSTMYNVFVLKLRYLIPTYRNGEQKLNCRFWKKHLIT